MKLLKFNPALWKFFNNINTHKMLQIIVNSSIIVIFFASADKFKFSNKQNIPNIDQNKTGRATSQDRNNSGILILSQGSLVKLSPCK